MKTTPPAQQDPRPPRSTGQPTPLAPRPPLPRRDRIDEEQLR